MAKKPFNYLIPYDRQGRLMHYPQNSYDWSAVRDIDMCPPGTCPSEPGSDPRIRMHITRREGQAIVHEPDWRPNDVFHCSLQLQGGLSVGRSAKYVHWGAVGDPLSTVDFPMFVSDLVDVVRTAQIQDGGVVSGRWRACKRGQNYGLMYWGDRD